MPWGLIPQENYPLGPNGQGRGSWILAVLGSNPLPSWGQNGTKVPKHVARPILAPESRFWGIRRGNLHHFLRSICSDQSFCPRMEIHILEPVLCEIELCSKSPVLKVRVSVRPGYGSLETLAFACIRASGHNGGKPAWRRIRANEAHRNAPLSIWALQVHPGVSTRLMAMATG